MGTYLGKVCTKHPELQGERYESSKKCKRCQSDRTLAYKQSNNASQYNARRREHQRVVESKSNEQYMTKLARNKRWYSNNKHWFRARNIAKKAGLLTPLFFTYADAVRSFYANRPEGCHVDHIVPLKGLDPTTKQHIVSGLHVPWNLQYLPGGDNIRKWAWFNN